MSEYKSAKEFLEGMDWDEIRAIESPEELHSSIVASDRFDDTLEGCREALEEALEEAQRRSPLRSQDGRTVEEICGHFLVHQSRAKEVDIIEAYDEADDEAVGLVAKLISLGCQRAMPKGRYASLE